MDDRQLNEVILLILSSASEGDLEALTEALGQRRVALQSPLPSAGKLARDTASGIRRQVERSMQQVRGMVREAVATIIHRDAPELSEEQVKALLEAWVPEESAAKPAGPASTATRESGSSDAPPASRVESDLPPEAMLSMVRQFVVYSSGMMSVPEQARLLEAIPDWPRKYWSRFPDTIRRLISGLLKERITVEQFWGAVQSLLFEPADGETPPAGRAET
jgi:hypothetical protein